MGAEDSIPLLEDEHRSETELRIILLSFLGPTVMSEAQNEPMYLMKGARELKRVGPQGIFDREQEPKSAVTCLDQLLKTRWRTSQQLPDCPREKDKSQID